MDTSKKTAVMIYGATGYVGEVMAREAVVLDLQPIIAGRNAARLATLATDLFVTYKAFALTDPSVVDAALEDVRVVLNCAGPFLHTAKPLVEACLRTGTHYLDITGEIPVFDAIAQCDDAAKAAGVMLMPGTGFDVVPTDCLAMYLKKKLPSATRLTLAFQSVGASGLPPGTQRTMLELLPYGSMVREDGELRAATRPMKTRMVDFGSGPVEVTQFTWGDLYTAHRSTGIPDIEDYTVLSPSMQRQLRWLSRAQSLMTFPAVRRAAERFVKPGPTASQRAKTTTHVWGQVTDAAGKSATARLHGPEAGVEWTVRSALCAVQRVQNGEAPAGYQTPAMAFGADFVLDADGVTRENVKKAPVDAVAAHAPAQAEFETARSLDEQRAEFAARRGVAMPLAGTIAWFIVALGGLFLGPQGSSMLLFIATGSIAYLGMYLSNRTGERFLDKTRPKNVFDRLFMATVAMSLMVYAIAIPFFLTDYSSLPLTVGILSGLMWLPFAWIVRHWIGVFHTVARTLLVTAAWYVFPESRFVAVPLVIVLVYAVTLVVMEARWRQAQLWRPGMSTPAAA
ncbi:MAG: saccharopine dehydrogenase NADP-binding domain-containing protein [Gemmatimonadaceae bacterium]|nr:saccharopine dehydrogenase NADP-binding domain-containing protein [Gemmatimonadaceae bacterium]